MKGEVHNAINAKMKLQTGQERYRGKRGIGDEERSSRCDQRKDETLKESEENRVKRGIGDEGRSSRCDQRKVEASKE